MSLDNGRPVILALPIDEIQHLSSAVENTLSSWNQDRKRSKNSEGSERETEQSKISKKPHSTATIG